MTAPADRCPACGTEHSAPPVRPFAERMSGGCLIARYRCPACRCRWLVGWDTASLGEAA